MQALIQDTRVHFATGRWMWHTWTLIQLVRRVMEYDAVGDGTAAAATAAAAALCTSDEMYTVLHRVAAVFLDVSDVTRMGFGPWDCADGVRVYVCVSLLLLWLVCSVRERM
jgi:hypothetical protein